MAPVVYDTFMLGEELDMLELRLTELEGLVDYHVLVESQVTHRGDPKPLYYLQNRGLFEPWNDKIIYVEATLFPDSNPWVLEHKQRDAAMSVLRLADPDDVVLVCDVDEVPSRRAVEVMREHPELPPLGLSMRMAMYAVDWLCPGEHVCSVVSRVRDLGPSLSQLRDRRMSLAAVSPGGWHLTWMGGLEAQRRKLETHCHLEMTPSEREKVESGRAYYKGEQHGGWQLEAVEVDDSWPAYVREGKCPQSWFRPR